MTPEHMLMRIRYLEGAVNEIHKVVDELIASIKATQAKVGIDNSEDPKSLDYRVGKLEGKDRQGFKDWADENHPGWENKDHGHFGATIEAYFELVIEWVESTS